MYCILEANKLKKKKVKKKSLAIYPVFVRFLLPGIPSEGTLRPALPYMTPFDAYDLSDPMGPLICVRKYLTNYSDYIPGKKFY